MARHRDKCQCGPGRGANGSCVMLTGTRCLLDEVLTQTVKLSRKKSVLGLLYVRQIRWQRARPHRLDDAVFE